MKLGKHAQNGIEENEKWVRTDKIHKINFSVNNAPNNNNWVSPVPGSDDSKNEPTSSVHSRASS